MTPRGGARPGAGRKPLGDKARRQFAVWLPPELAEWGATTAEARGLSRSELIAKALDALRAGATTPAAEPPQHDAARRILDRIGAAAKAPLPTARWGLYQLPGALADRAVALGLDGDPRDALARVLLAGIAALEE